MDEEDVVGRGYGEEHLRMMIDVVVEKGCVLILFSGMLKFEVYQWMEEWVDVCIGEVVVLSWESACPRVGMVFYSYNILCLTPPIFITLKTITDTTSDT